MSFPNSQELWISSRGGLIFYKKMILLNLNGMTLLKPILMFKPKFYEKIFFFLFIYIFFLTFKSIIDFKTFLFKIT